MHRFTFCENCSNCKISESTRLYLKQECLDSDDEEIDM